jgi:hypothetical protein
LGLFSAGLKSCPFKTVGFFAACEVVPFQNSWPFFAACEVVPFQDKDSLKQNPLIKRAFMKANRRLLLRTLFLLPASGKA